MKTILTKALTVSSKYQITVPQTVRELLKIQQNDEVVFTTDGENVFFEKVQQVSMYGQLITFIRHVLQQGHHVYITGNIGVGKSYLAHEIASYEFNAIEYVGENYGSNFEKAVAQAIATHTSLKDVVILDEYQRLQSMGITVNTMETYKGALLLIAQSFEQLPLPKNKKVYHVHLTKNAPHFEFELKLYEPFKERYVTMEITLEDLPSATTLDELLEAVRDKIKEFEQEQFLESQQLALINEITYHMKSKNRYTVNDILPTIDTFRRERSTIAVGMLHSLRLLVEEQLNKL